MSSTHAEGNKALVLKAFDTLFNQRDYVAAERFWSPDYIQHSAHIAPGRQGLFDLIREAPAGLRYEPGIILADEDHVMVHGRFSGTGRPQAWVAVDIVRVVDGVLVEHWDVLQDEVTSDVSRSGRPMFGDAFPAPVDASKVHRRVVTGHRNGKSAVLNDQQRPAYSFRTVKGFEQTYVWAADRVGEADPEAVDLKLPKSALPVAGGSLVQIVTFPPAGLAAHAADPAEVAQEYLARLPGLADTFERDGSQMHVTQTLDYAIMLDGELWLELDDGEPSHLSAGDVVVQQGTRHGWRNRGTRPATIAFVMLGA